jgi:hypothetical protein
MSHTRVFDLKHLFDDANSRVENFELYFQQTWDVLELPNCVSDKGDHFQNFSVEFEILNWKTVASFQ